ncbi:tetratricopeptide repeat protein [Marivirga arenosa]|uniref:histidine kinase n=1 Tax=Marivirga arenosa TaxID=3059076 RepID=A0AA51N4Y4_9BACT|nr:tetratricopeptide repeat protein [Marivirga sp. ABR2-2]WMN06342.1 tetratricopeptide repeat protein [Marivirga sp. ABR2-2]
MRSLIIIWLLFIYSLNTICQKSENTFYEKAKSLRSRKEYDSSINYFLKAVELFKSNNDSLGISKSYNYLGINYNQTENKELALNYYYDAIRINKKLNYDRGLVSNYNNLGNYYNPSNIKLALEYYKAANKLIGNTKDRRKAIINMNIGTIYASKDTIFSNNDSAIYYYLNSLQSFNKIKDTFNIASIYHNLGVLYENEENLDASIKSYNKALELSKFLDNDYMVAQEYMSVGNILLKEKKYQESLDKYEKSLQLAKKVGDEYRKMHLYSNIVKVKMQLGEVQEASNFFEKFNNLRDSLYSTERMKEVKNLETKYETELKEAEIKEQQKAIEQKNFQKNLFLGLSFFLVLLVISTIWFFLQKQDYLKKLKNEEIANMKTEQELKELNAMMHGQEEERNRIASDLHDRLGARLSSIKLLFQSGQNGDSESLREKLLININEAIKETREISHNLSTDMLSRFGLETALKDIVRTINDAEKINADLSIYGLQKRLSLEIERNIYHIVLELINNTIKHAEAQQISIQISLVDDEINLFYEDDGKGFDVQNVVDSGLGMRSIYARINTINGAVYFNSKPGQGINVVMNIPVKEVEENIKSQNYKSKLA